jgi:hypothetical protein
MNSLMKKFGVALAFFSVIFFVSLAQAEEVLRSRIIRDNYTYSTPELVQLTNLQIGWQSNVTVPNGKIQILLYASNSAGLALTNDGISDPNAFDWGGPSNEATASCPQNITGEFEFAPAQIEPADLAQFEYEDHYYHVITCAYTGAGSANLNFGYSGGNNFLTINNLLNPRLDSTAQNGTLIYTPIWVRQLDALGNLVNESLQTVTSSRSVQMLAQISPLITLTLDGVNSGATACGHSNSHSTTGTLANFGIINELNFTDIAQKITITTNVTNGYVLTAVADDQMRKNPSSKVCGSGGVGDSLCIPDAQVTSMSPITTQSWTGANEFGLGYTLEHLFGDDPQTNGDAVFVFTDGYRHFADTQESETPVPILRTLTGRESQNHVCYRIKATPTNQYGVYNNEIIYTLTANF